MLTLYLLYLLAALLDPRRHCLLRSLCASRNVLQDSTASGPVGWHLLQHPGYPQLLAWAAVFSASAVGILPPVTPRHPYARYLCVRSGVCVSWMNVSPVISPVIINNPRLSHILRSFVSLKEALHRGNWCKSHQLGQLMRNHSITWLNAVSGRLHNTSNQIKRC